jgi:hypothetical protein
LPSALSRSLEPDYAVGLAPFPGPSPRADTFFARGIFGVLVLGALFLVAAYGVAGAAVATKVGPPGDGARGRWDFLVRSTIAGFAMWVGTSWALALAHGLVAWAVASVALAGGACGVAVLVRARASRMPSARGEPISPWTLTVLVPVTLWVVYAIWRSTVVPVENHDGIAYHLPRAVLFLLDHGYRFHADIADPRLATWPANYEILLSTILLLGGSDQGTVVVGLLGYLGLAAIGASLCERWWGASSASLVTFALVASTPLAVLHSGAHKNDLLLSLFAAGAVYWLVPWALRGRLPDALYGIAALGLAIGTKAHGGILGVFCLPLLVMGAVKIAAPRRIGPPLAYRLAYGLAYGLACATLLGGCVLILNLVHVHGLGMSARSYASATGPLYGEWGNLWRFPVVMLLAPFTSSTSLWVPWCAEPYWWNEFDLYWSHYGGALSLAVLAIPAVEWARRHDARPVERGLSCAVVGVAFATLLPLRMRPFGFFIAEARYHLAIVPFVFAWACGGVLTTVKFQPALSRLALGAGGAWLAWTCTRLAQGDTYQPFAWVVQAATADAPPRAPPVQIFHRRVGYLVDEVAGPRDVVAVDLGFDTWVYPVFGKDFLRPVRFIAPAPDGPATIPADATWVAIDRGQQELFFTHPALTDFRMSLVRRYFGQGTQSPDNFRVLQQMKSDPAFELTYLDPRSNQALFHRRR